MESLMKDNQPVYVFESQKVHEVNDERFTGGLRSEIRHMIVETKAVTRENLQLKKSLKSAAAQSQLISKLTYALRCEKFERKKERDMNNQEQ